MYFDNPGLNDYYFIDPHWLYYVFCRVCTSSMLTCSSKIDSKYIYVTYKWFLYFITSCVLLCDILVVLCCGNKCMYHKFSKNSTPF